MIGSKLPKGAPKPVCHGTLISMIPRDDLWDSVRHSLLAGTGVIAAPQMDTGLIVEVTGAGPKAGLEVGTICWMNGWHVGRYVTTAAEPHWIVESDRIVAVMNSTDDPTPTPRGTQMVTKADQEWMEHVVMGESGAIYRPIADDGTITAGVGTDPKRVAYEVVVAVSEGCELGYQVGDLVAVPKDHGTTEVTLHGSTYTIIGEVNVNCTVALAADRPVSE